MPSNKKGCTFCGAPKLPGRGERRCATCKNLCPRCRERPRVAQYCAPCAAKALVEYNKRKPRDTRERQAVRCLVNIHIKLGKRERQPCAVCSEPETQIFVTSAKKGEVIFLCKDHHAEFERFYKRGIHAPRALQRRSKTIRGSQVKAEAPKPCALSASDSSDFS